MRTDDPASPEGNVILRGLRFLLLGMLAGCQPDVPPSGSTPSSMETFPVENHASQSELHTLDPRDAVGELRPREKSFYHEVRAGESLGAIARQYGLSVERLVSANGLSDPNLLQPGQLIYIPGVDPSRYEKAEQ